MPVVVGQDGAEDRESPFFSEMFDGAMWTFYSPLVYDEDDADWVIPSVRAEFEEDDEGNVVMVEYPLDEKAERHWAMGWTPLALRLRAIGDLLGGEPVPMEFVVRPEADSHSIKDRIFTFLWKPQTVVVDGERFWSGKDPEESI